MRLAVPADARARRDVVDAVRVLARQRLVTGTSGNVSARLPDGSVLITPSGRDYARMRPRDLATVRLDGTVISASFPPSSEVPLHLAVYRETPALAVVHTHQLHATAVGLVDDELPSVHYAIRALGGPVRVAPYATFGSRELAAHVVAAMRDRRAAILRNHGAVTTGATVAEALANAEKLEWLAELYLRSRVIGKPAVLSSVDLATVAEAARTRGYRL